QFKPVLDAAFESQLDGAFTDEAGGLEWMRNYLRAHPGVLSSPQTFPT
ncbi:MAG: cca, partial [Lacunisphaera sp.]|nr:cca [Lacunisphaera sp.]